MNSSELLVKQYFGFLVEEYGFSYSNYRFQSRRMYIHFDIGHKTPRVYFCQTGDPEFTKLEINWVLRYLHESTPLDARQFTEHSLEDNMIFTRGVFRKSEHVLIEEFEKWWLPAQVFLYKFLEKHYKEIGILDKFLVSYKGLYDYLKEKGAM